MTNHNLKTVIVNHIAIDYFYTKEKKDVNGNSRYRVYIIDPEAPAVYEKIFKCYEIEISERVKALIEGALF